MRYTAFAVFFFPALALAQEVSGEAATNAIEYLLAGEYALAVGALTLLLVSIVKRAGVIAEIGSKVWRTVAIGVLSFCGGLGSVLASGGGWTASILAGLGAVLAGPILYKAFPAKLKTVMDGRSR